jgi:uncharacterized protein
MTSLKLDDQSKVASSVSSGPPPVIWKRHDLAGHESCRVFAVEMGWRLTGVAVFAADGQACRLEYEVACDEHWVTKAALVQGWLGARAIETKIVREASGQWHQDGQAYPEVAGCLDIDLNFSPSTNLLPLRRLNLAIEKSAVVRAAWLEFPSIVLQPLEQTYTRLEERKYRYESGGGEFVADLLVDDVGFVMDYGPLWSREVVAPQVLKS